MTAANNKQVMCRNRVICHNATSSFNICLVRASENIIPNRQVILLRQQTMKAPMKLHNQSLCMLKIRGEFKTKNVHYSKQIDNLNSP